MKVMLLGNGKSIHMIRWANSLCAQNEVFLVCTSDNIPIKGTISENVQVFSLPYKAPLGYYTNFIALKRLFKKHKPNIVNAHYVSGYGTLARLAKVKPLLLSAWGSDVYAFPYENKYKYNLVKKNLIYANRIASTSNCMATQIRRILNSEIDISITPFGTDVEMFSMKKKHSEDSKFVFSTIKTLSKLYRIDLLIEAYALFVEKLQSIHVVNNTVFNIYGEGPEYETLLKLISEKKLNDFVFLRGYAEHSTLPKLLHNTDIFLLGSEKESFGVAAVEAMACGVPVIASNAEGFKEVIFNQKTGIIVESDFPKDFAEEMFMLFQDDERRNKISKSARERVLELYDWNENVKTMQNVYDDMLKVGNGYVKN